MDVPLLDNPDFTLDFSPKALVLVAFKCLQPSQWVDISYKEVFLMEYARQFAII